MFPNEELPDSVSQPTHRKKLSPANYSNNPNQIPILNDVVFILMRFIYNNQRNDIRIDTDCFECLSYTSSGFNIDFCPAFSMFLQVPNHA
jgi:hypothetical protein